MLHSRQHHTSTTIKHGLNVQDWLLRRCHGGLVNPFLWYPHILIDIVLYCTVVYGRIAPMILCIFQTGHSANQHRLWRLDRASIAQRLPGKTRIIHLSGLVTTDPKGRYS